MYVKEALRVIKEVEGLKTLFDNETSKHMKGIPLETQYYSIMINAQIEKVYMLNYGLDYQQVLDSRMYASG